MTEQDELAYLREENNRLKAILELREDNREFERYQVQTRNKLLLLLAFTVVLVGGSTIYYVDLRRQLNETIKSNKAMAKQIQTLQSNDGSSETP